MKLMYVTTHYPSVSHTFISREIAGLRERGFQISTVAINHHRPGDALTERDRVEERETAVLKGFGAAGTLRRLLSAVGRNPIAAATTLVDAQRGCGLDLSRRIRRSLQAAEGLLLAGLARRDGSTHVHAHFGQAPANIAWFASLFAHRRGQVLTWSMTIHGPQDCLNEPPHLLLSKMRAVSFAVTVADFTSAQLIRHLPPELWGKVHVVRNGVASPHGHRPSHPRQNPPRIVMVARLSPEKGHPVALEALALLRARGVGATLELIGPGDFDTAIRPVAERWGVQDAVTWLGALAPDAVAERMAAADVYCLASFAEGLPTVVIEAMHAGAVVVASGISGVPELVDASTGFLVPPARADLLADALGEALNDPERRTVMAETAAQRAADKHNPGAATDVLSALFRSVGEPS